MNRPRIYADFQNLDDDNRLILNCRGTRDDLARFGVELVEGMQMTFWTDDANDAGEPDCLLVDGVVRFDGQTATWVAVADWTTVRHESEHVVKTP